MAEDTPADRYPDSEGPFAGPNNTFPLNTAARVRNAWARIHQQPTMANHSAAEIASIRAKIRSRAKELGIELSDDGARSSDESSVEHRNTMSTVEVRTAGGHGNGRDVGGYAAMFNRQSKNLGTFVEVVERSFFNKSRADGWVGAGSGVVCRYEHDNFHLLGSTQSGTLRLSLDEQGLDYVVDVPESRQDVYELVSRGDIRQSSFAFIVGEEEWGQSDMGYTQRTLHTGLLIDVAPVSVPAYQETNVALRSLAAFKGVEPDEVFTLAEQRELRKLFQRTDIDGGAPPKTMSGARARMYMMGKRPRDPLSQRR
jgi:HK97 family phage prohead protease